MIAAIQNRANTRAATYFVVAAALVVCFVATRGVTWQVNPQVHTVLATCAAVLALLVGTISLVHFYSERQVAFIVLGAGFVGAALLDGFYLAVTSNLLPAHATIVYEAWSWNASRSFLAVFFILGWLTVRRQRETGTVDLRFQISIGCLAAGLLAASFLVFFFVPLPTPGWDNVIVHRPEEFVPGLLFLFVLITHLKRGNWRNTPIAHSFALFAILSVILHGTFMAFSAHVYDLDYMIGHGLKVLGYAIVFGGLLFSIHAEFVGSVSMAQRLEAANRMLDESRARIKTAMDNAVDAIITIDRKGRIATFNRAAEEMFGYTSEEIIGENVKILMPEPYRSEHDDYLARYRETGKGKILGVGERELKGRHKDGSVFDIELGIARFGTGNDEGLVGTLRDISRRKEAEELLDRHVAELARSNAELEQFAYIASHDLQEPLRKIQTFGDRLIAKYAGALDNTGRDYLARMQSAAARMQTLITDLLTFSRVTSTAVDVVRVDLNEVVHEAISDFEPRIEEVGARVTAGDMPAVEGNPVQLHQLFQNLLGNALKYHAKDRQPVVTITGELVDGGLSRLARIEVEDNGIGFDQKHAERVFGVFQRLQGRDDYEGTGVGLAICRKIVERHGGMITVVAEPGEGAKFIITLPERQRIQKSAA